MPTGYTAAITDKDISFEQFVWDCARAFGALVLQRDDAIGSPIKLPEPSPYNRDRLVEIKSEIEK